MIHSIPTGAGFSYRRLRGMDPVSAGVQVAIAGAQMWMASIQQSHNADTATTLIVNGLEEQLRNLVTAYMGERNVTCADQRAALNAYDSAWLWLQSPQACGVPGFGRAGNACISDRAPGGRWPWRTYYRDPIANDPRVAGAGCDTGEAVYLPSITSGAYGATGITSTGGSSATGQTAEEIAGAAVANRPADLNTSNSNYLLIAGAALAAVVLAKVL